MHNVPWLLSAPAHQMYNIFCLKASMPGLQKIQVTCWAYFFLLLYSRTVESSYAVESVEEVKVNREFECRSIFIFLEGREILLFFKTNTKCSRGKMESLFAATQVSAFKITLQMCFTLRVRRFFELNYHR